MLSTRSFPAILIQKDKMESSELQSTKCHPKIGNYHMNIKLMHSSPYKVPFYKLKLLPELNWCKNEMSWNCNFKDLQNFTYQLILHRVDKPGPKSTFKNIHTKHMDTEHVLEPKFHAELWIHAHTCNLHGSLLSSNCWSVPLWKGLLHPSVSLPLSFLVKHRYLNISVLQARGKSNVSNRHQLSSSNQKLQANLDCTWI